MFLLPSDIKI